MDNVRRYRELGLILTREDAKTFLRNYVRKHPMDGAGTTDEEQMKALKDILYITYANGEPRGADLEDRMLQSEGYGWFEVIHFTRWPGTVEFRPASDDVTPETAGFDFNCDPEETVAICSDCHVTRRYVSLDHIKAELKAKAGEYLPGGFDYESHIGDVIFSCREDEEPLSFSYRQHKEERNELEKLECRRYGTVAF